MGKTSEEKNRPHREASSRGHQEEKIGTRFAHYSSLVWDKIAILGFIGMTGVYTLITIRLGMQAWKRLKKYWDYMG